MGRGEQGVENQEQQSATLEDYASLYRVFLTREGFEPSKSAFRDFCAENGFKWSCSEYSLSIIRECAFDKYKDLKDSVFNETMITKEYHDRVEKAIKTYRSFIVTSAVVSKAVNLEFFDALRTYAKKNHSAVLILPCADASNNEGRKVFKYNFDPVLNKYDNVFILMKNGKTDSYFITPDLAICTIEQSAKKVYSLAGLDEIVVINNATTILGSPKQEKRAIPTFKENIPKYLCSTGSVTMDNYNDECYMSKRTSMKAKWAHVYGAFIVERSLDGKKAFIRPVQASPDGSFTDLNIVYKSDGTTKRAEGTVLVNGDAHAGAHDNELYKFIISNFVISDYVDMIVLHDICDSASCNHHEVNDTITKVSRTQDNSCKLQQDINNVVRYLNELTAYGKQVVVVNSNHDNFIERSIRALSVVTDKDYPNMQLHLGAWLYLSRNKNANILEYLVTNNIELKLERPDLITWLGDSVSYKVHGVELGMHGHQGANGAKGSLTTTSRYVGKAVIGHSHSSAIKGKTFQVGTTSEMDMGYNKGLSSWTRTCCLVHADGTMQLIDFFPTTEGSYEYRAEQAIL